jgi:hypothetical protein
VHEWFRPLEFSFAVGGIAANRLALASDRQASRLASNTKDRRPLSRSARETPMAKKPKMKHIRTKRGSEREADFGALWISRSKAVA